MQEHFMYVRKKAVSEWSNVVINIRWQQRRNDGRIIDYSKCMYLKQYHFFETITEIIIPISLKRIFKEDHD